MSQHSCGCMVTSGGTQLQFCSCSHGRTGTKTMTCLSATFPNPLRKTRSISTRTEGTAKGGCSCSCQCQGQFAKTHLARHHDRLSL